MGTGAGQNAAALARRGHDVIAVAPFPALVHADRAPYGAQRRIVRPIGLTGRGTAIAVSYARGRSG